MMTDHNQTYHTDHFDMYRKIESLCCVTGTNNFVGQVYFKTNSEKDQICGHQRCSRKRGNWTTVIKRYKLSVMR